MKSFAAISFVFIILLCLVQVGCEPANLPHTPLSNAGDGDEILRCDEYAPAKIDLLPLTVFKIPPGESKTHLVVYVSLLDSFGSQIIFPTKFRFELYERVQRSAEPKGRRVGIWPGSEDADPNAPKNHWFDLTDTARNNRYWRDYIRAYSFNLPFKPVASNSYILEATCLTHDRRRLTAEVSLRKVE